MPNLFILLGPSGSGKTTLAGAVTGEDALFRDLAVPHCARIITTTTRPPRSNERNGREYWFRSAHDFEQDWKRGDLLERATYHGNNYGLRKSDVSCVLEKKDGLILMEPQGAQVVCEWKPETHLLYLLPLPEEELRARMMIRGASSEDVAKRLSDIPGEYEAITALIRTHNQNQTHPITNNGPIVKGIQQITDIILSERKWQGHY